MVSKTILFITLAFIALAFVAQPISADLSWVQGCLEHCEGARIGLRYGAPISAVRAVHRWIQSCNEYCNSAENALEV